MKAILVGIYRMLMKTRTRYIGWLVYSIKNPKLRKVLAANEEFRDKYKGKRCFILGNGPSLKEVDLSSLRDEYTFTVNQLPRNPQFYSLKTTFHFWADPVFFNIDPEKPEDMELLRVMKSVRTKDNDPVVFFPIEQVGFSERFQLDKDLNIRYYRSSGRLKFYNRIDFTKQIPNFGTVVQFCIMMAIFMGFSEIYLLGCDNTHIINQLQSALKGNAFDYEYSYSITDNEKKRMENQNRLNNLSLYNNVISYANSLQDYTFIGEFCEKRGIALVNCTRQSLIEGIPKASLESVLAK